MNTRKGLKNLQVSQTKEEFKNTVIKNIYGCTEFKHIFKTYNSISADDMLVIE